MESIFDQIEILIVIAALAAGGVGAIAYSKWSTARKRKMPTPAEREGVHVPDTDAVSADEAARELAETVGREEERPDLKVVRPKTLSEALSSTQQNFFGRIRGLFTGREQISKDELEALEEVLYTSDLGPQTVQRLMEALEGKAFQNGGTGLESIRRTLKNEMLDIFARVPQNSDGEDREFGDGLEGIHLKKDEPTVWMIVGVNGAGKTTTIGKLAGKLAAKNYKILLAAGDTFRAAAGEQLAVWTDRAQVEIFSPPNVKDPSAVAFDAINKAKAQGYDVVLVDTAGRLHTQTNLMEELKKVKRVMAKVMPDAPHEVLLVLDANSGQNALIQAREFHEALNVTGIVLTKMDGTAKGGVALGVANELKLPVKLIGVGEGIEDLRPFSPQEYVDSIL